MKRRSPDRSTSRPRQPYEGSAAAVVLGRIHAAVAAQRARGDEFMLPHGGHAAHFAELLGRSRRDSLRERLAYYEGAGLLEPDTGFVRVIAETEQWAVWLPSDNQPFAYTIGLFYLYDLPELLLIDGRVREPFDARSLAMLLNQTASKRVARNAPDITEGAPADDLIVKMLEASAPQRWAGATDGDTERYLGNASWFHVNFMDTFDVPTLVLRVEDPPGKRR